jgi:hypothetical protein
LVICLVGDLGFGELCSRRSEISRAESLHISRWGVVCCVFAFCFMMRKWIGLGFGWGFAGRLHQPAVGCSALSEERPEASAAERRPVLPHRHQQRHPSPLRLLLAAAAAAAATAGTELDRERAWCYYNRFRFSFLFLSSCSRAVKAPCS